MAWYPWHDSYEVDKSDPLECSRFEVTTGSNKIFLGVLVGFHSLFVNLTLTFIKFYLDTCIDTIMHSDFDLFSSSVLHATN